MKRALWLLPLALVAVSLPSPVLAQDADRIFRKMRQLDLLNQVLPVLMTPAQIKKILPAVEKARSSETTQAKSELERMKKVEAKVDEAIKEAKSKGSVPTGDLQVEVRTLLLTFNKERALMIIEQNESVLKAVEETLDEGQIKAAANSITFTDDKEKAMTDRDKLRRWVRAVLMDPLAYDLLVELSRGKG